ncbi:hypothetical protein ACRCF9_23255 [Pseudomonas canadensis]|uniref:hypothetical protein n=1 Tax=Pseudomonas TaxID=286 RepID=UPI003D6ACACC
MTTLISSSHYALRTPANAAPLQTPVAQTITRHRREATAEPVPLPESGSSRETGDKALAALYGHALLKSLEGSHDEVMVENVPHHSTFGQWWAQLGRAMESRGVKDWLVKQNADMNSVKISPESGEISFKLKSRTASDRRIERYGPSNARWADVGRFVKEAGSVASSNSPFSFQPPLSEDSSSVPLWLIGRFYGEGNLSDDEARTRAQALIRDNTFVERPSDYYGYLDEARSEDKLGEQKAALADNNTRLNVVISLKDLISTVTKDPKTSDQILDLLNTTRVRVEPDSTYPQALLNANNTTSLKEYITEKGWNIPKSLPELRNLEAAILSPAPQPTRYGNYGGALAWPIPLSTINQQKLKAMLNRGEIGNISTGSAKSVLDYLMQGRVFDPSDLRNPRSVIDTLIQSPKGKALGEAIKAEFDALEVECSAEDWLLTALSFFNLHPTYPMSSKGDIPVAQLEHGDAFGRSAQQIFTRVADDLLSSGAATSPENARVHAHLLLSSKAPEYLVKDIPEKVTLGSHSWVSFTTAVARLEAKSPGSTASMSYGDVMLAAEIAPISAQEQIIEYEAQERALKYWGLANGLGYPMNETSKKKVRDAYNEQISELKTASGAQNTPMPTAKDIALAELKKALPEMTEKQFEEKCLTLEPYIPDYPGPYSVLDLYLKGKFEFYSEPPQRAATDLQGNFITQDAYKRTLVSSSTNVNITELLPTLEQLPNVAEPFTKQFSEYSHLIERNTAAQVKHLIATQPLNIRRDLEFGSITIMREDSLKWKKTQAALTPEILPREHNNLIVRTVRNGQRRTYEIDPTAGRMIERLDLNGVAVGGIRFPEKRLVEIKPEGYADYIYTEHPHPTSIPYSFDSSRTHLIADAFKEHIDIKSYRDEAQGLTTFDTEIPFYKKAQEFFFDLIPLRSAIVNFSNGNIQDGFGDLIFDAFGFVIGLGAAAKGAKALHTGASAADKAIRVGKILGRAAVGALNPIDGLIDLGKIGIGLAKKGVGLAKKGTHIVVDGFRSITRNADDVGSVLLSSKHLNNASVGTFKVGSETVQGPAIFKNDNWYAYNPTKNEAFGSALVNFKPTNASRPLSHADLTKNWDKLMAKPGRKSGVCYTASVQLGEAEQALSSNVLDAIRKSASTVPGTNYTPAYLELMGINPANTKSIFNPAEISESGLINFKSLHGEKNFKHTVYLQKTEKGELFLYNFNGVPLDGAMLKNGHPLKQVSGGGFVYDISHGNHKGLQDYLDHPIDGAEYTFTTAGTLNANVQKLKA